MTLAVALLASILTVAIPAPTPVEAGVYFNDSPFTYKEYWASHDTFTSGCGVYESGPGSFYVEPQDCVKEIELLIEDDTSNAIAAVINVNLWRNRRGNSARFTINDGPQYRPNVGANFSRTPFTATVPLEQLQQGSNSFKFQEAGGPYHVHDVMIRVYYNEANPLIPGPGADITPPTGELTGVRIPGGPVIDPDVGGALDVDGNQVILTADAEGASRVEFFAYYEGYDEDNDGVSLDWHNFLRMNYGPGGTEENPNGATIGHIGTDSTAPYEVTWNLPEVINQEDIKFKIRVVDSSLNVLEAPRVSADFDLQRSYLVDAYDIPGFADQALYFDGAFTQSASDTIYLPSDLAQVDRAILLGNYWNSPDTSINGAAPFPIFEGQEDEWNTSQRELDVNVLKPGANTIEWAYLPPGFGAMVEKPGPMMVLHRPYPSGPPVINAEPEPLFVDTGRAGEFRIGASGELPLSYQWVRNGTPIVGATSSSYLTSALQVGNDGDTYGVVVTNAQGSVTSSTAIAHVSSRSTADAPWWDNTWDFRMPTSVGPFDVEANDRIVAADINFSEVMLDAGTIGQFDPNSLRVIEVDVAGNVVDANVPFQFEAAQNFAASNRAFGEMVWELTGNTAVGETRRYHIYFDQPFKSIPGVSFTDRLTRDFLTDDGFGFPAWRFNLEDGSEWTFHHKDGGGFSSVIDADGQDWLGWNPANGTAGDFRGFPNATKPPNDYFHPGRANETKSTLLNEGPLRVTYETRAKDNSWVTLWHVYPNYVWFEMSRANKEYWVLYEGQPGGEIDATDFIQRSDGTAVAIDGTFHGDLPTDEWMYAADPLDNRSFFMTHEQNDGGVESYRLLNDEMSVMAFGRGGLSLNFPYTRKLFEDKGQSFAAGLANSTDFVATGDYIRETARPIEVAVGPGEFKGVYQGPVSDDFESPTLNPRWVLDDPIGDATVSVTGSAVRIDIPPGLNHDMWTGRDNASRLLQNVADTDLEVSVKFNTNPTVVTQAQALLFVQDADNWIQMTVTKDGLNPRVAVLKMVDGVATQLRKRVLGTVPLQYLRVKRIGNAWVFERSWNGERWFDTGRFNIPMELNQAGLAISSYRATDPAPGYLSEIEYYLSKGSGDTFTPGPEISDVQVDVTSRQAVVSWTTDVPADTRLDHGPTIDVPKFDDDFEFTTQHSVSVPFLRCDAPYYVRPRSSNDDGSTIGGTITIQTDPCTDLVSDDFSSTSLSPEWELYDPLDDIVFNLDGTNAILSVPAGVDHNLFPEENFAARLRQDGPVGDFGVEAKFDSVLSKRFQIQGIVVEEDDDSYLRFEYHHDGDRGKVYVASILDDVVTTVHYGNIPNVNSQYMRVTRVGNVWSMEHSVDGSVWNNVTSLTAGIESAYVSPYFGSTSTGNGTPPAFVGSLDYFFNLDSPIVPEDGGSGADITPPTIVGLTDSIDETPVWDQAVTLNWTTDEPGTTSADWGFGTAYGSGSIVNNVATLDHELVIQPLNCGSNYHYRVYSNDASGNQGQSADRLLSTPPCPAGSFSDNFDAGSLDARWFLDDPRGDSVVETGLDGLLSMTVPAEVRHDLTPSNNGAVRLLQAVPDGDFQVKVGFESVVNFRSQLQGIVFETDDDRLIRFDLFSDGTTTKAFVGRLTPTNLQALANLDVPGALKGTLQVTRTGNNWLFEYSSDGGTSWATVLNTNLNLSVARFGPFVGNAGTTIATVPEHIGLIDYFWTSADPIAITVPGQFESPVFEVFAGGESGTVWDGVTPLEFGVPAMVQPDVNIRGRVTDPDGIASITYSVNGGEPVAMGIGSTDCEEGVSCTRRLVVDGDFNVDMTPAQISGGSNLVRIRALDTEFNESFIDVPFNYSPGGTVSIPHTVDWSTVTDLQDVAQQIDGRWSVDTASGTLGIDEIGYDRLIGFGDPSWSSFEAEVPITIHSFDPAGYAEPSGGPGIGFIPHWQGHGQVGTTQPKFGFSERLGALVWYRYRGDLNAERFEIRDSTATLVAENLTGRRLPRNVTQIFKMQAETGAEEGPIYRLKAWEQGTPEPEGWDIVTSLPAGAVDQGSLLLVAHHVDATWGNLEVRKLRADQPRITPDSGSYAGLAKVSMSTGTSGADIRYTTDGSIPTSTSPVYAEPFFIDQNTIIRAITYRDDFDPSPMTSREFEITQRPDRVAIAPAAEYRFEEGSGTTVSDSVGTLDLDITAGSDVTWLPDNGLRINNPSVIRTPNGAGDLNNAIKASQAITVEMWIDPLSTNQTGAHLLNIASESPGEQNLALVQNATSLEVALRTSKTDNDGQTSRQAVGVLPSELQHVVYVRRPDNSLEIYVDGQSVHTDSRNGSLSAWGGGYPLALANSLEEVNPWLGDLYHVSMYTTDLTSAHVLQNFQAGVLAPPTSTNPVVDAGDQIVMVEGETTALAGTATDDGVPSPLTTQWTQLSGPGAVAFSNASSRTSNVTPPLAGTYVLQLSASDGGATSYDQMNLVVLDPSTPADPPSINPPTGSYPLELDVFMSTTLTNAEIRYTVDGSTPTVGSPLYSGPITITESATFKARVYRPGIPASPVITRQYVITAGDRNAQGLLALYTFNETSGSLIVDETLNPLNLKVSKIGRTTRVPSGLRVNGPTVIRSNAAKKINDGVKASGEMTLELWFDSSDDNQFNKMILGLTANNNARNLGINQVREDMVVNVRSNNTNVQGSPGYDLSNQTPTTMSHLVITKDSSRVTRIYLDGVQIDQRTDTGSFANWSSNHKITLSSELDGSKAFEGTYYLLAFYDWALPDTEVARHFEIGDV